MDVQDWRRPACSIVGASGPLAGRCGVFGKRGLRVACRYSWETKILLEDLVRASRPARLGKAGSGRMNSRWCRDGAARRNWFAPVEPLERGGWGWCRSGHVATAAGPLMSFGDAEHSLG